MAYPKLFSASWSSGYQVMQPEMRFSPIPDNEFEENWKDYVEQDIHKLSSGVQLFRQKLMSLISEGI
ncbi:hypothetical protein [Methanocalculus sp.]|uniref:hypothetical protein n=1 Tax=Methanocalculus sp. TaxID=2004547 RepID=UPI0017BDEA1E|nr:hypothetical protein [Methanocalculus sp.]HIJ05905.1 hypothetical protein [Methanocalculus sp.]